MSRTTPRRAQPSGPLDPIEGWPEEPEQLELLDAQALPRRADAAGDIGAVDASGGPGGIGDEAEDASKDWRPPPAVTYLDAAALAPVDGADPTADDPDLPFWLAFNHVKGIGPARFALLLGAFVTARAAWEAGPAGWRAAGLDERTAAALARQRPHIEPEAEVERLSRLHVTALTLKHSGDPALLREIAQPPPVLYVRERLTRADDWAVAIVGT